MPIKEYLARRGSLEWPMRVSTFASSTTAKTVQGAKTEFCSLKASRKLAYVAYGPLQGFPILYFHGFPSSRLEGHALQSMAFKYDLRFICPDRAGFGLSSPHPGRSILDYPIDMVSLVKHLGINRYSVLGGSGGGPYALACGHRQFGLPRDEVVSIGIFAGAPPWEAGVREMMWWARCLRILAHRAPWLLRPLMDTTVYLARKLSNTRRVRDIVDQRMHRSPEASSGVRTREEKDETMSIPESGVERLFQTLFEPFSQGSTATIQEMRLLTQPWGFDFKDIDRKIVIWHGTKDSNAPIGMLRWMARKIPRCELNEFDETHFSLLHHLETVVKRLAEEAGKEQRDAVDSLCGRQYKASKS